MFGIKKTRNFLKRRGAAAAGGYLKRNEYFRGNYTFINKPKELSLQKVVCFKPSGVQDSKLNGDHLIVNSDRKLAIYRGKVIFGASGTNSLISRIFINPTNWNSLTPTPGSFAEFVDDVKLFQEYRVIQVNISHYPLLIDNSSSGLRYPLYIATEPELTTLTSTVTTIERALERQQCYPMLNHEIQHFTFSPQSVLKTAGQNINQNINEGGWMRTEYPVTQGAVNFVYDAPSASVISSSIQVTFVIEFRSLKGSETV